MKTYFLIIGVLALCLQVNAQTGTSESAPGYTGRLIPSGWTGFAEISSGYTAKNNNIPVEGTPSSVKILGSYYSLNEKGVFDLGVGAHTQTFIDNGALDSSRSATVMEAGARYQFENRWQLGVVYNQFFNVGTNYFSDQGDALFGGLAVMKEFSLASNNIMRVGLRAMRDLNTLDQDVNIAQLDLAFGWNPHR